MVHLGWFVQFIQLFVVSATLSASAFAGTTATIPIDPRTKRPAGDLVYHGRRIDESEASELIRRGEQIWNLNPEPSQLWRDESLDYTEQRYFPADGATVYFNSNLASFRGIFRVSVDAVDPSLVVPPAAPDAGAIRPFTLSVSLQNPAATMRAALLRRIGYQVSGPKNYRTLTVRFNDVAARDQFLENLADRSLTSRNRWIKELPEGRPEVTLQGVVLEPGRIRVQTVHWGQMSPALQQDRRVFRALLLPDVLFDFQEKINQFAWETGRIFSGNVLFDYLYTDGFPDVTYDDLKWILGRIATLSREDFRQIVAIAQLPEDISAVLVEKLVSRRNGLVRMFGLESTVPRIGFDPEISIGNIAGGQLVRDGYTGYPQEFYATPEQAPLRFSQIWRFATIQGLSAVIGQALGQVNQRLLTLRTTAGAIQEHQDNVSNGISDYLFRTGGLNGYSQSTGVWGMPLAGGHVNASRNVIAGTYLGSDSQVQLVDTLLVDMNAGYYLGWDGMAPVAPGGSFQVVLSRSYSHVKPVRDMKAALRTNWGQLVVAGFMIKLGRSLNPDVRCEIPEEPWTSEFTVDGVTFTRINYDENRPNGREEALAKRQELIAGGMNADRIVLQANNREEDCKGEVADGINDNLNDFLEDLAVGDTFIITDSIKLNGAVSVRVPVPGLNGLVMSPNGTKEWEFARQTMIRRTANGYQIYLQDRRLDLLTGGVDVSFYMNVLSYLRGRRHGHADTDYYNIVLEGADTDTKRKFLRSLRALLISNNAEVLTDSFQPYTLAHDLFARISRFKFLFWSRYTERQTHEVDIYPPVDRDGNRNRSDYKRTLAMRRLVTRTGRDLFGFATGLVSTLTGGIVSIPANSGGDPSASPGGRSLTSSVSTQAEVTEGSVFKPVTVFEEIYRGQRIKRRGLMRLLDRIEDSYGEIFSSRPEFSRGVFDRSLYNDTVSLQLYQIDSTLLFYPQALDRVKTMLVDNRNERAVFNWLVDIYGSTRNRLYCETAEMQFGRNGPQVYRGQGFSGCAPDWVHSVLRLRREGLPEDSRAKLGWYNGVMSHIINNADLSKFLARIDSQNYFFLTRVNGFRKGDANGEIDYLSDTVGKYDNERGLGLYNEFSSSYGMSLYELYARFFTEGL